MARKTFWKDTRTLHGMCMKGRAGVPKIPFADAKPRPRNMKKISTLLLAIAVFSLGWIGSAQAQESEDGWNWSGDFRLRFERSDEFNNHVDRARDRSRLRFRFGGDYAFNETVKIGARLVTGDSGNSNSTHEDVGGGNDYFGSFDVSLDRLYMNYSPEWAQGTWFQFGKFGNPFQKNPVWSGFVWDGDVQPEGVAFGRDEGTFSWTVGEYVLDENSSGTETLMTVAEVRMASVQGFGLSVALYDYDNNVDSILIVQDDPESYGNLFSGTAFESDFTIFNAIGSYRMNKLIFALEYMKNLGANTDNPLVEDTGYAAGFSYQLDDTNKVYYQYADIGNDSILADFAQDDLPSDLGSGWAGNIIGWKHDLGDNMQANLWMMAVTDSAYEDAADDYRIRLDFNLKF